MVKKGSSLADIHIGSARLDQTSNDVGRKLIQGTGRREIPGPGNTNTSRRFIMSWLHAETVNIAAVRRQ
jgi:hypothetical protein